MRLLSLLALTCCLALTMGSAHREENGRQEVGSLILVSGQSNCLFYLASDGQGAPTGQAYVIGGYTHGGGNNRLICNSDVRASCQLKHQNDAQHCPRLASLLTVYVAPVVTPPTTPIVTPAPSSTATASSGTTSQTTVVVDDPNKPACLITYKGKQYDPTGFQHEGGQSVIQAQCGLDAESACRISHNESRCKKITEEMRLYVPKTQTITTTTSAAAATSAPQTTSSASDASSTAGNNAAAAAAAAAGSTSAASSSNSAAGAAQAPGDLNFKSYATGAAATQHSIQALHIAAIITLFASVFAAASVIGI